MIGLLAIPLADCQNLNAVGCVHRVARTTLTSILGEAHYVETDSRATFGGEEDWWAFRLPSGHAIAICLRVPYEDVLLYSEIQDLAEIMAVLPDFARGADLEVYDSALR